jgi:aminopeptidase-like protein
VEKILREEEADPNIVDFWPYGYDERQYNSPAFRLNVGLLLRSRFGLFPEYHTSADNMDFIKPEALEKSYKNTLQIIDILENEYKTVNLAPHGEPNLGKRGLYGAIGGDKKAYDANLPVFWMLNQSDGQHSLLDIAQRAKLPYERIHDAAKVLSENNLLRVEG